MISFDVPSLSLFLLRRPPRNIWSTESELCRAGWNCMLDGWSPADTKRLQMKAGLVFSEEHELGCFYSNKPATALSSRCRVDRR